MKKDKRTIYAELSSEANTCLCSFCKHAQWVGECSESYPECGHPIWEVPGKEEMLEPGQDCWGFRPEIILRDIADIVGMVLSNGFDEWYWQKEGDNILVGGRKLWS